MWAAPAPWPPSTAAARARSSSSIAAARPPRRWRPTCATARRSVPRVDIVDGDYDDLKGAGIVLITVGVNEKTGGATDRNAPLGRLKLLDKNAEIYRDVVPRIVRAEPQRGAARGLRSTRSARRHRARGRSRGGGAEHGDVSRQPALSRSPRQAFRCRSR